MSASERIKATHLQRCAYVYVRQSTASQVQHNRESTDRQYKLADRALRLGYPKEQVKIIEINEPGRWVDLKVKVVQLARERWRASSSVKPTAADLSRLCGLSVEEIFQAENDAQVGHDQGVGPDADAADEAPHRHEPATAQDEVEARVDTGLLMRRLERYFATLPENDRKVIDAYLGIGLTPVRLAKELQVSPSRVSQMFKSVRDRIEQHMAQPERRSVDRAEVTRGADFDALVARREAELAQADAGGAWSRHLEDVLVEKRAAPIEDEPLLVDEDTRWG